MESSNEEHLGYFQVLLIMNKAAVNIYVQALEKVLKFSTSLGRFQGAGLLDCMVRVCLVL